MAVDNTKWTRVTELFCSVAMLALAGCGGGGRASVALAPAAGDIATVTAAGPSTQAGLSPQSTLEGPSGHGAPSRAPAPASGPAAPPAPPPAPLGATGNQNPAGHGSYHGMPYNVIDGSASTTDWPMVSFDFSTSGVMHRGYPDKSDCTVIDEGGCAIRACGTVPDNQRRFPFPHAPQLVNDDGHRNDPFRDANIAVEAITGDPRSPDSMQASW